MNLSSEKISIGINHANNAKHANQAKYSIVNVFSICFSILNVSAIVLANLCVSYIMTSQNEEAEELMRKIEKEEEQVLSVSQEGG